MVTRLAFVVQPFVPDATESYKLTLTKRRSFHCDVLGDILYVCVMLYGLSLGQVISFKSVLISSGVTVW